jgi:uncharacterized lipoprotein YajG
MYLNSLFLFMATILLFSGCASKYTSIEETNKPDQFHVTKTTWIYPLFMLSDLKICDYDKENEEMNCKKFKNAEAEKIDTSDLD